MCATARFRGDPASRSDSSPRPSRRPGICYFHLQALGTPPEGRLAGRRREWDRFWAIVDKKLARPEAELALEEAAEVARAAPSCLLCYEADWQICHRRRIADILAQRHGFAIRHLAVGADTP